MSKLFYSKEELLRLNQKCETPPESPTEAFQKLAKNHHKTQIGHFSSCKPTLSYLNKDDDDNGPNSSAIRVC